MAKSKNHTNHNQSHKAHRNGIKKPQSTGQFSRRYMDQKYLRNLHFARKHNRVNLARFVADRNRKLKEKKATAKVEKSQQIAKKEEKVTEKKTTPVVKAEKKAGKK
ncbi:putative large subunit ribosomal protein L29e [Monocercomonoides exilis]|uniref:putative large subunit ribosomal protein L29e n=1 Tax=Monocercomonoides exilis TaxID=2049356 RepID=UPI003559DCD6|nr:putative large subunit ribosomal protein L29e [Monocercomonoides exilis]|eukprot:MONOS_5784.1-p1 / transcript=MONOS_5784.1 / gene=MONOS_5784 / organism=Monocercomonoides_exilis_PA203 / gene_product=unspecified product / transcript_product=unspecified product / location=Mono_scaffold00173:40414-40796(+) / protein_length=105 / sequence_SO=supercontig / SO=protein_coding / is_pseudo=false